MVLFRNRSLLTFARTGGLLLALSVCLFAQGKNPVILIPGLSGSELYDKTTGEKVWFKALKSKSDDLRLPISPDLAKNHDNLVPGEVLKTLKIGFLPGVDFYSGFVKTMELRGGYHEEKWDAPSQDGDHDSLYTFPYDWRLDNVENARRLYRDVEALKQKLKKPDLKFDVVAHSMGGILARYAAMYGDSDLPAGNSKIKPTWAGAHDFDKIVLMGVPNEGAMSTLSTHLIGYAIYGVTFDVPFLQDASKFTVFTIPSAFQMLPAQASFRAYDEKLQPMEIDIYDPKTWTKYGWNPIDDRDFTSEFSAAEQKTAPAYLAAQLARAKRLHEALAASGGTNGGVSFFLVGSDCKQSPGSILLYRDRDNDNWRTIVQPKGFTRSDGTRVSEADVKKLLLAPGDGLITLGSLEAESESKNAKVRSIIDTADNKIVCEDHNKLAANARVQDYIINVFDGKLAAKRNLN